MRREIEQVGEREACRKNWYSWPMTPNKLYMSNLEKAVHL